MPSDNKWEMLKNDMVILYHIIINLAKQIWSSRLVQMLIKVIRFIFKAIYNIVWLIATILVIYKQLPPRMKYDLILGLLILGAMINCMVIIFTS